MAVWFALVRMPFTPKACNFSCYNHRLAKGKSAFYATNVICISDYTYVYHGGKCIHDVFFIQRGNRFRVVARDTVGDIGEQLGEIGDFEYLIQGEKLQSGDSGALQDSRERPVRKGALSFLLDHGELSRVGIGKPIW